MILLPAIDLIGGQAVRLYQGDYEKKTVYDPDPLHTAQRFAALGAQWLHLVDLDGAKSGRGENRSVLRRIAEATDLKIEIGGGIRTMDDIADCLALGADRVILGTAAVTDPGFAAAAAEKYGEQVAVGVDIRDGFVAIRGWTEKSAYTCEEFCGKMQAEGVKTLICTDVSKDGAMQGTNLELYRTLADKFTMQIIASGGVSSLTDVRALTEMGLYGAIVGKAYYTGAVDLAQAIAIGKGDAR